MKTCATCKISLHADDCYYNSEEYYHYDCWQDLINKEALNHGIPKGVVLSNEKLSDYFNKNYIDHICNKGALKAGKGDI